MDAVVLALTSAALFGGMTVVLRAPLARGLDAELGALLTVLPALGVAVAFAVTRSAWDDLAATWPFLLAGILGPGISQFLFTIAVRDAGPSRASVTVGTAPLFAVAIALVVLDEPVVAGVLAGGGLIVAGGILLASERGRPEHVKLIGLAAALAATIVFATRDNLVRWLAGETEVDPALACVATLAAGSATMLVVLLARRVPIRFGELRAYAPAGLMFGISYVCLFEAYYRGPVTVVSPLVATESLWGVALSALFLRQERVGPRLVAGAALVVAGGVLIGVFR